MKSVDATRLNGGSSAVAATTTTTASAAAPATSSSNAPLPPSSASPSYTFSAEATPFIPSFMRAASTASVPAPAQPALTTAASASREVNAEAEDANAKMDDGNDDYEDEEEGVEHSTENSDDNYRQRFSKMWMLCLEQMQGHEVGMLMDMLPLDIQDLYFDKLSDEYLHHDHEYKDKGVHALCAAQKMVKELSPEQLAYIEEFLVETDALNPEAERHRGSAQVPRHAFDDGGAGGSSGNDYEEKEEALFVNEDEGIGMEEEEWLLEQMMLAAGHADEVAAAKKRK